MTAEGTTASTALHASDILATAASNGKTVGGFIDLSVVKTVTTAATTPITTPISELQDFVEIFIPLDAKLQGKSDYVVYRYHGIGVDTITTSLNADGESIVMVDSKTIKLTVKKFSTYAIAYKDTATGGTTGGGSEHNFSVIEKLIVKLPSVEDFKEINLPEFEIIEIEYKKNTMMKN